MTDLNMSPQLHVDLETLGIKSTSQMLSIGAVIGENEFYVEVDTSMYGQNPHDFTLDQSTVDWWEERGGFQPTQDTMHSPYEATALFVQFVDAHTDELGTDWTIWANSPSFDCAILLHHMWVFRLICPWRFYQERDVRSIKSLAQDLRLPIRYPQNPHNALEDAKNQQEVVRRVYLTLARTCATARSVMDGTLDGEQRGTRAQAIADTEGSEQANVTDRVESS